MSGADRHQHLGVRVGAVLVAVGLVLAGCTSEPEAATPEPVAWTKVDLPAEPVVLAGHGADLLVGLRDRGAKVAPRILVLTGETQRRELKVEPKSAYAFEAVWQSIAYDGKRVLAIGGAAGGAHSNKRWTVWTGTATTLTEHPQEFNTFGGQSAGQLYSAVLTPAGQALLGSWGSSVAGLDAAVWLPQGLKWIRQDSANTALRSTASLLVGAGYGTTVGSSVVQTGSQVRLAPNVVQQEAAVWRSANLNQGWARVALPEPGNRSQGNSVSCTTKVCTISGFADGKLALWQLDGTQGKRLAGVPDLPVSDKDKLPPPIDDNGTLFQLIANGNNVKVVRGHDGAWTVQDSTGPAGTVRDAKLVGRTLYLLAGPADGPASLWKTVLS